MVPLQVLEEIERSLSDYHMSPAQMQFSLWLNERMYPYIGGFAEAAD